VPEGAVAAALRFSPLRKEMSAIAQIRLRVTSSVGWCRSFLSIEVSMKGR